MTNTPTATEVMDKYKWSALAASVEDESLIRAALEEQVYSFGWNRDEAEGVIEGALASEEGIAKALKIYSEKYEDAFESMKVLDVFTAYDNELQDFLGEDSDEYQRARREFETYASENVKDISKKVKKAHVQAQVKNSKDLGLSDEEVESAKDTLRKYQKVMGIIGLLEQNKLEALRPKVRKRATKRTLKDLLKSN